MIDPVYSLPIHAIDLIMAISHAIDSVSPHVADHHVRTAIISGGIARVMELPQSATETLIVASVMHDIGFFNSGERLAALNFEYKDRKHAEMGYALLKSSPIFSECADIIRNHHTPYVEMDNSTTNFLSNILFVADRVEVFLKTRARNVIQDYDKISKELLALLKKHTDESFMPEIVEAVEDLCKIEAFWFSLENKDTFLPLKRYLSTSKWLLGWDNLQEFARVFKHILDWRSPFTVTHSSGVRAVSVSIAELMGFSEIEISMMGLAGWLHDIGKLAIPLEILNKPGPLTHDEMNVMKRHAYLTYIILDSVRELDVVKLWAALHHEKLTGDGYPFRLSGGQLLLGSRIMAVADIFAALTESRPYREAMDPKKALDIIKDMANAGKLCMNVVRCLENNLEFVDNERSKAQQEVLDIYQEMERFICEHNPDACNISAPS